MRKSAKVGIGLAAVLLAGGMGGWLWYSNGLLTRGDQKSSLLKLEKPTPMDAVIGELAQLHLIKNADAYRLFARISRTQKIVPSGTYTVRLDDGARGVLQSFSSPMRQFVRLPETNWARRNSNLLGKADVCEPEEYMRLVRQPHLFKDVVSFPLPKTSLEGYLYPDTYDLPPLLGAKGVIERQLKAFEKKVWLALGKPQPLDKIIRVASLVEMETARANERPIVAGVIENRLRYGMRLQIDASINYGLQKWRPLLISEYKSVKSPYNLYLYKGLPPTPICSPSLASIKAAIAPAKHEHLYYVALPSGQSLFSQSFDDHRVNIGKRKAAIQKLRTAQVSEATQ